MNTLARLVNYIFVFYAIPSFASIPPEPCFANFRWDDCGKPPVPVMYYYKPGSRCEVAMWRGCLPNPNMFPDEYSCINTCIYVQRADLRDYDQFRQELGEGGSFEDVTEGNVTTTEDSGNATTTDTVVESERTDTTTVANDEAAKDRNSTTNAAEDGNPTTAAAEGETEAVPAE